MGSTGWLGGSLRLPADQLERGVGIPSPDCGSENGRDGLRKRKRHRDEARRPPLEDGQTLALDDEQALAEAEQSLAHTRQALAQTEQTLADTEQALADSDRGAAESDQAASDSDQAASDQDLAHGGEASSHDRTRDIRARGTRQRIQSADARVDAATARDAVARARDRAARARDDAAASRDSALALDEAPDHASARGMSEAHHSELADGVWAAEFRAQAAVDREQAAADRRQAAADREHAARDRLAAETDREELLQRLLNAETDELTGARTRSAGLADLEHEIARARRGAAPLATAYVDIVGLKSVNDKQGHTAGDALLRHAVHAIREHMRSYDLIVRMGGDEFLCVLSDATVEIARTRFDSVQAALAADKRERCEIRFGVAELTPEDSALDLVKRADAKPPCDRPSSPPA